MNLRRWMPLVFPLLLMAGTVRLLTTLTEPGADDGAFVDFRDTIHAPANALFDGVDRTTSTSTSPASPMPGRNSR